MPSNNVTKETSVPIINTTMTTAPTTTSCCPNISIGLTRVRDAAGYRGTIQYVGPVASATRTTVQYAGVQWDDPHRGKHNGSVIDRITNQWVTHFHCPHPTGATFVKLDKVDVGVPLTIALLQTRYVQLHHPERVADMDNKLIHTVLTSRGGSKPIEFLGELQIRNYQQLADLRQLSLRRCGIYGIDTLQNFALVVPNLVDLDLAGNLFHSWQPVMDLLTLFPNLQALSLASNHLHDFPSPLLMEIEQQQQQQPRTWPQLQRLNLHSCQIQSWQSLLCVGRAFPNLQELCVAYAKLGTGGGGLATAEEEEENNTSNNNNNMAERLGQALSNLQDLDVSSCGLQSTDLLLFGMLPNLICLRLDGNPIDQLWLQPENENNNNNTNNTNNMLCRLQHLQLAETQIAEWSALIPPPPLLPSSSSSSALSFVAATHCWTSLRLRKCPLTQSLGEAIVRFQAIARLPLLTTFNGAPVRAPERLQAERRWLHSYYKKVAGAAARLSTTPPLAQEIMPADEQWHYHRLAAKHGDLVAAVSGDPTGSSSSIVAGGQDGTRLADSIVNISVTSMVASSCTLPPLTRRLPSGLTVSCLKLVVWRHFGLEVELQRLHMQMEGFPVELDDNDRSLEYYGVTDGAELLLNQVNLETVYDDEKKGQDDFESRLEQQENELNRFQERQRQAQR